MINYWLSFPSFLVISAGILLLTAWNFVLSLQRQYIYRYSNFWYVWLSPLSFTRGSSKYLGRVSTEHFSLEHVKITAVFKKGYSSCLWPVCHRKRELYSETFSSVNRYLWSLFSFETMIMLTSRRPPVSHAWLMCACQCKNVVWAPVCVFSHLLNVHRRNNLKIGKTESVCSIFIYLKAPKNENGSVHC